MDSKVDTPKAISTPGQIDTFIRAATPIAISTKDQIIIFRSPSQRVLP